MLSGWPVVWSVGRSVGQPEAESEAGVVRAHDEGHTGWRHR